MRGCSSFAVVRLLRLGALLGAFGLLGLVVPRQLPAADDDELNAAQEQAMKAAVRKVAPCVVQIETTGGTELISGGRIRKGVGPTTGLIVSSDGYIISSAFNFANRPSAVHVSVPGRPTREVARIVATDTTRMLTLLKIAATGLPVPVAAPKSSMQVGQWALALGRTLDPNVEHPPSVSVGIISALGRIWGKAIQTDAKVSPVNYGGPLIDIRGRVLGVLVPASPQGQDETAGVEWYDSGIGFAIPLEDINAVLPRLKEGKDLKRGLLGITPRSGDLYSAPPVVGTVAPDSAAAKAGIQPGDVIIEVDGQPVTRHAQLLHLLGGKYEGDVISLKVRRGKEEIKFDNLVLSGTVKVMAHGFLGVLPVRDDPELGEEVRYVFPKSPADKAGLKPGDRIMKIGPDAKQLRPFSGRDELTGLLNTLSPGAKLKVEVIRKDGKKTETLDVVLDQVPDVVPDALPERASAQKALAPRKRGGPKLPAIDKKERPEPPGKDDKNEEAKEENKAAKKPEIGLRKRSSPSQDREYWLYVPENYDPNISHALVVWLHPAGRFGQKPEDILDLWSEACQQHHLILLGPKSENETGWTASESEAVLQAVQEVLGQYTIDRQRIVAHGMGVGGQLAFYLGFHARDLIRGVATTAAVLTSQPKDNILHQRLSFFIVAGQKDPLVKEIADSKAKLVERKFPVIYREIPDKGHEYLDGTTLKELIRWIDSLDRQ
ncbi:MAG: PDZ domain-containing protein [Gemmataceae bacterium]|nr:PDZ domain-containing protein [Gemmataceae bacterium]MDW8266410.1 PDZ domain-containing protein [Gemmataceae bacterium]